jgi:hypothetical protein
LPAHPVPSPLGAASARSQTLLPHPHHLSRHLPTAPPSLCEPQQEELGAAGAGSSRSWEQQQEGAAVGRKALGRQLCLECVALFGSLGIALVLCYHCKLVSLAARMSNIAIQNL